MNAERIIWALLIALVLLFVFALLGYFAGVRYSAKAETAVCSDIPEVREKMRSLLVEGLDNALRDRSQKLFEVWMSDDAGQPERAQEGVRKAGNAYMRARHGIADWDIPRCTGSAK